MIPKDFSDDIKRLSSPGKAKLLQRFFKTGKGEYAEEDIFLGLVVPQSRKIAKKYMHFSLQDLRELLQSQFHEYRQIGLFILIAQYKKADIKTKKDIVDLYLSHIHTINNWDLVDVSAGPILGEWLWQTKSSAKILMDLAHTKNVWEKRISLLATFAYLYHGEDSLTYIIAEILLDDRHDLIQKALGWMLREAGKRVSLEKEKEFIRTHYHRLGRIALRYAIERFPEKERKEFLHLTN